MCKMNRFVIIDDCFKFLLSSLKHWYLQGQWRQCDIGPTEHQLVWSTFFRNRRHPMRTQMKHNG
jgi:protein-S-isoprenylcysteine O-methyltransferase Ste14